MNKNLTSNYWQPEDWVTWEHANTNLISLICEKSKECLVIWENNQTSVSDDVNSQNLVSDDVKIKFYESIISWDLIKASDIKHEHPENKELDDIMHQHLEIIVQWFEKISQNVDFDYHFSSNHDEEYNPVTLSHLTFIKNELLNSINVDHIIKKMFLLLLKWDEDYKFLAVIELKDNLWKSIDFSNEISEASSIIQQDFTRYLQGWYIINAANLKKEFWAHIEFTDDLNLYSNKIKSEFNILVKDFEYIFEALEIKEQFWDEINFSNEINQNIEKISDIIIWFLKKWNINTAIKIHKVLWINMIWNNYKNFSETVFSIIKEYLEKWEITTWIEIQKEFDKTNTILSAYSWVINKVFWNELKKNNIKGAAMLKLTYNSNNFRHDITLFTEQIKQFFSEILLSWNIDDIFTLKNAFDSIDFTEQIKDQILSNLEKWDYNDISKYMELINQDNINNEIRNIFQVLLNKWNFIKARELRDIFSTEIDFNQTLKQTMNSLFNNYQTKKAQELYNAFKSIIDFSQEIDKYVRLNKERFSYYLKDWSFISAALMKESLEKEFDFSREIKQYQEEIEAAFISEIEKKRSILIEDEEWYWSIGIYNTDYSGALIIKWLFSDENNLSDYTEILNTTFDNFLNDWDFLSAALLKEILPKNFNFSHQIEHHIESIKNVFLESITNKNFSDAAIIKWQLLWESEFWDEINAQIEEIKKIFLNLCDSNKFREALYIKKYFLTHIDYSDSIKISIKQWFEKLKINLIKTYGGPSSFDKYSIEHKELLLQINNLLNSMYLLWSNANILEIINDYNKELIEIFRSLWYNLYDSKVQQTFILFHNFFKQYIDLTDEIISINWLTPFKDKHVFVPYRMSC